jgi:hypothetical protein
MYSWSCRNLDCEEISWEGVFCWGKWTEGNPIEPKTQRTGHSSHELSEEELGPLSENVIVEIAGTAPSHKLWVFGHLNFEKRNNGIIRKPCCRALNLQIVLWYQQYFRHDFQCLYCRGCPVRCRSGHWNSGPFMSFQLLFWISRKLNEFQYVGLRVRFRDWQVSCSWINISS